MLQRLHQVGAQRVAQQRRHGALRPQVTGKNGGPRSGIAHQDAAQPLPQIRQIPRQTQNRHDLAGHADLEAVPAGNAVGLTAQPDLDLPQGTVVHIHAAAEHNPLRVQRQRIALMNVVVDEGRKQIVGGGDGMDIPGKVQVDLLHRQYLRIPAAGGAALQPEYRAQRRLPQGDHRPLAQKRKRLSQPDGGGRLALPGGGGVDGGDKDQLALRLIPLLQQELLRELGLAAAVGLHRGGGDPGGSGNLTDRLRHGSLGNLNIGHHDKPPGGGNGKTAYASRTALPYTGAVIYVLLYLTEGALVHAVRSNPRAGGNISATGSLSAARRLQNGKAPLPGRAGALCHSYCRLPVWPFAHIAMASRIFSIKDRSWIREEYPSVSRSISPLTAGWKIRPSFSFSLP